MPGGFFEAGRCCGPGVGQPCAAGRGVRPARRCVLGFFGHLRPAAARRLRHSCAVGHLRAPGHRGGGVHGGGAHRRRANAARVRARRALAGPDSPVRRVRRGVHPAQLPYGHRQHQRGHRNGHPADRPGHRHGGKLRARPARPAPARGGRAAVRPGRRVRHRHAGRPAFAFHLAGRLGVGPHVRRRAGALHASARARAGEVGLAFRHGAGHAVRRRVVGGARAPVGLRDPS